MLSFLFLLDPVMVLSSICVILSPVSSSWQSMNEIKTKFISDNTLNVHVMTPNQHFSALSREVCYLEKLLYSCCCGRLASTSVGNFVLSHMMNVIIIDKNM